MAGVFDTSIKIKGIKQFRRNLLKAGRKAHEIARAELQRQTARVLGEAMERAPIKRGLLRKNTKVQAARIIRRKAAIGGRTLPIVLRGSFLFRQRYAEIQHENLRFRHPQGGEAKFAEKALKNQTRRVFAMVALALRRAL